MKHVAEHLGNAVATYPVRHKEDLEAQVCDIDDQLNLYRHTKHLSTAAVNRLLEYRLTLMIELGEYEC